LASESGQYALFCPCFMRLGRIDSPNRQNRLKKPFYPEQLENEAWPNHLHSSRAVSVHAYILWVRHLSRRALMACQ
jgi:hypothetical protein